MIKTEYVCDKCAKSINDEWIKSGLFAAYFNVIRFRSPLNIENIDKDSEMHFCGNCYDGFYRLLQGFLND